MAKVAFIQEELRARFGIMILSAVLKEAGHECEVFVQERSEDVINELLAYEPDIVGFSTMTAGIKFAIDTAKIIKEKSNVFILMGGPHPTFYPEIIKEGCLDAVCIGEGEFALLELANAFDKKSDFTNIHNLWVKNNSNIIKNDLRPLVDVNKLPMCDRELYYDKYSELAKIPTQKFFIVRGCPFSCTYCFNHSLKKMYKGKGQFVRFMNADKIIAEMKYVREKYGIVWVQFNGDTMNVDRKWFMEFLDRYKKEIDLPFICNLRIERVDEEMVKKMREAKCDRVDFGIEHGDDEIRRKVLKRNMSNEKIINGGRLLKKYGIRIQTANIVGVPHETIDTAMKTVEVNRQIRPELSRCFSLQPYPRTEIYDYALEKGFLSSDTGFSQLGTGFQIGFNGSANAMTLNLNQRKELTNLYYFFDVLVKCKWLEPLIKVLIKLPPNRFFLFIHAIPIVWIDVKFERSWKRKLRSIWGLLKVLLKK